MTIVMKLMMSLTSGMSNIEVKDQMTDKSIAKKEIKLKDVEKFVKICAKMGAVEVKVGEIQVIFGDRSPGIKKPRKADRIAQEEAQTKADFTEQMNLLKDDIAISHLEDPLGFEEAIARGEILEEIHSS